MKEIGDREYLKLMQQKKIVSVSKQGNAREPEKGPKPSILAGIKDAIVGIQAGIMKVVSWEGLSKDRNDALEKIASTMQGNSAKEWVFTIERDKNGFIEKIKVTRR